MRVLFRHRARVVCMPLVLLAAVGAAPLAGGQTRTYSTDADFDEGVLVNLNHNAPFGDQLQLNPVAEPFPFINVAASGRGTMIRLETNTGQVLGEYKTSPDGRARNPSRTTVDQFGNVWTANRDEAANDTGSVVKFGIIIGGTRGNKLGDGSFVPDPNGEYLQPPFAYNTCVDRDGDGLIRTSRGLGNILAWTNAGGADDNGGVSTADDEAILLYIRLPAAPNARHVSVDANNDVWVAGYPFTPRRFYKLDGETGAVLDQFEASALGAGGYGGFVDGAGILWSASISQNALLRYDPATHTGFAIPVSQSYGLGVDSNGFVWNSTWENNHIAKISPAGVMEPGFPKPSGGSGSRGVVVTPIDNDVWIANSHSNTVTRLDNAGNLRKTIPVGLHPTGVARDAAGKVWVTNYNSHDVMRIDPNGGADTLGAVDLTVPLGAGANPYNYSDMTGAVAIGVTSQQGTWTVVFDSGENGVPWGTISWSSDEPVGTFITSEVRAADSQAGLPGTPFQIVGNGVPFHASGISGRFIEIRTTLARLPDVTDTPVLYDLTVAAPLGAVIDISPNRTPNLIPLKRPYTVYVAVLGSGGFDASAIDGTSVRFGRTGEQAFPVRSANMLDLNQDGIPDALFGFRTADCGFTAGDTAGVMKGRFFGGVRFEGADSIVLIP